MIIGAFLYLLFEFCSFRSFPLSLWECILLACLARLRSSDHFDFCRQYFRPVGDSTFSVPAEKVSKETGTESLSNSSNVELSQRTSSYDTSVCRMNLQQTSCLLLLKVIYRLGKFNDRVIVAVH